MKRAAALLFSLFAFAAFADDPTPIEDHNFGLESGWNRDDSALQYATFFLRDTSAFELTHEWAARARHQFSYTIPIYSHAGETALGDAAINYRYQLAGGADARVAVAPRLSLLLPTRGAHFGERSSGLQVSVPVSAAVTSRLTSHTNVGATWFRDLGQSEVTAAQGFTFAATSYLALALDAGFKRAAGAPDLVVVRPGVQLAIDLRGVRVGPGLAYSFGEGMLFYVAVEQSLP